MVTVNQFFPLTMVTVNQVRVSKAAGQPDGTRIVRGTGFTRIIRLSAGPSRWII